MVEVKRDNFLISDDKSRLRFDVIHAFLANDSYWAKNRSPEQTKVAIDNSVCFGVYQSDKQIGFARVVSDHATFAYLGDLFILPKYRDLGLGKWLMSVIVDHPDLQGLRRWLLATRDAHGLYSQFEFSGLKHPERWMERSLPDAY